MNSQDLYRKETVNVVARDTVTAKQVEHMLRRRLPDARPEDLAPFVELVTDGRESVSIEQLLLNAYCNTVIPFEVSRDPA